MSSEILIVTGMSCDACVGHVTRALTSLPGTSNVKVDLKQGKAFLDFDPQLINVQMLIAAIEDEGYSASPVGSA
jgi:Cu+-exporting ATPase